MKNSNKLQSNIEKIVLEKMKQECLKRQEITHNCKHELILVYGDEERNGLILKKARCLICERYYLIDEYLVDVISRDKVLNDSVIDCTKIVRDINLNLYCGNRNVFYLRAQDKLKDMFSNDSLIKDIAYIKSLIRYDLIEYDKEINRNINKLIKRNDNNE